MRSLLGLYLAASVLQLADVGSAAELNRARDLGIPFEGIPGALNAITDVPGVEVGHVTHVSGEGPLQVGAGPVGTGATMVVPRGKGSIEPA